MSQHTRMFWIHALTPLHVGAGRGVGYIDLPVMREKVTNHPLVPGSAVKGVLSDHFSADQEARQKSDKLRVAFGIADRDAKQRNDRQEGGANSGSLVFTDARLVCLPVRSLYGTFAWCTSPMILKRLHRDLQATGLASRLSAPAEMKTSETIHVPQGTTSALRGDQGRVFLEDLDFQAQDCPTAAAWASELGTWLFGAENLWATTFASHFAVVSDDVFGFLAETGTEVNARVRIDDTKKTVADRALWYEESLPAETILAGLVWCDRVFGTSDKSITQDSLLNEFCSAGGEGKSLQIGGKATVGKGRVRCVFTAANSGRNSGSSQKAAGAK